MASSRLKRVTCARSMDLRPTGRAMYRRPRLLASAMNGRSVSEDSRKSTSVLYPLPASQARPAADGTLPAASLGSTATNRDDAGRTVRGRCGVHRRCGCYGHSRVGLARRATTEVIARGRLGWDGSLRFSLGGRSDRGSGGLLGHIAGEIERRQMIEHMIAGRVKWRRLVTRREA